MKKMFPWLKKYFTVLLSVALVIASLVMTIGANGAVSVKSPAGAGKESNHSVTSREEFDALGEGTVLPLTYRATGRMLGGAAPVFESATVLITFREYGKNPGGSTYDDTWEFLFAATADALYLKAYEYESIKEASGAQEGVEFKREFEYYVKGSEVFIRCLQYREIEDGGIDATEEVLGYDGNEALALIAIGELRGKWVRATGTELMRFAQEDFGDFFGAFSPSYLANYFASYFEEVTFEGGEEPKVTGTNPRDDWGNGGYEIETGSVQYKYINNTVIKDISNKKTYELKDYLKEEK